MLSCTGCRARWFWRAWLNGWYFGSSGHDSERAAMIYQHEARGADTTITNAIDAHIQAEQAGDEDGDHGRAVTLARIG